MLWRNGKARKRSLDDGMTAGTDLVDISAITVIGGIANIGRALGREVIGQIS